MITKTLSPPKVLVKTDAHSLADLEVAWAETFDEFAEVEITSTAKSTISEVKL